MKEFTNEAFKGYELVRHEQYDVGPDRCICLGYNESKRMWATWRYSDIGGHSLMKEHNSAILALQDYHARLASRFTYVIEYHREV